MMHRGLFPLGVSTDCSLSHADLAFPSAADFQFADDAESFLLAEVIMHEKSSELSG